MRRGMMLVAMFGTLAIGTVVVAEDKPKESKRFDMAVREDIFAGLRGDAEAMKRGLDACEAELKKDPKHAEAMVWRGAGRVFTAGQLFGKNKINEAMPLWTKGLADMDEAVKLEPKNIGVRIPRAAVLIPSGRNAPPAMGKPLLLKAKEDYETIMKMQEKTLDKIGTHPRGELHMGLADVYRLLGEGEKSKAQLEAIVKDMPDTKYEKRAKEWLAAKPDAKLVHSCIGCHTP
ncbi:MAG: tetratricopeptide repeat protein [Fimbriiglobus sp.]